ncbi:MAG: hypothetical protein JHC84_00350 [Solirubrobacteraceae bacterium]|nr:hypothetical protein [Solirubrobacteraceae bacterium]
MIRPTLILAAVFAATAALPTSASAAIPGTTLLPFAGSGSACTPPTAPCGDGGPATAALLDNPKGVAVLPGGAVIFADTNLNRIRRVAPDGSITTAAGSGATCGVPTGSCGDGSVAIAAQLTAPQGVAAIDEDSFLIADTGNHKIRRVDGTTITTVAGTGVSGGAGDGGAPTAAELNTPRDVATRGDGSFLIADYANAKVRRVAGGVMSTVAGVGQFCTATTDPCGDGGASGPASLGGPSGISVIPGDGFLIAEPTISRIRRVTRDDGSGTIERVAGQLATGAAGYSGDGGVATDAQIHAADDVAALPTGGFAITDTTNHRVRLVDAGGRIDTVAGTGTPCAAPTTACGDGGPAADGQLNEPRGVAVDALGDLIVADSTDDRVRRVDLPAGVAAPTPPGTPPGMTSTTVPEVNETVLVQTLRGTVFIRIPGSKRAVPLSQLRLIPDGSKLDTRRGTARITVARPNGTTDDADLSEGILKIDQRSDGSLVDLRLAEEIVGCPVAVRDSGSQGAQAGTKTLPRKHARTFGTAASPLTFAPRAQTSARKKRRSRKGRVRADGRFRTDGKYGSAVVRGTQWLTIDDCRKTSGRRPQTRVVVREGKVAVRDFRLKKTKLVRAGQRYTAYARGS